ncbi:hypothetical protein C8R44DRAFT_867053 [Mycena epipterygia]|nr:hypothetical protein C8R44DRAFT_867053 [Mycena epipterygia]
MRRVTRAASLRSKPRPSTLAEDSFWLNNDVVLYMVQYLCLLDLIQFSQTSRFAQMIRKTYLRGRVMRFTSPFFARPGVASADKVQLAMFFDILESTSSWIVGSVALAVSSVLSDPDLRTNLNIITSYIHREDWIQFMVLDCGFDVVADSRCRGAYANFGARMLKFTHPDRPGIYITVTSSISQDIFQLFFSAPVTHQQIAVGSHYIITPQPYMTSNQESLRGWRPDIGNHPDIYAHVDAATYPNISPFPGCVTLHESSAGLGRACAEACPAIVRSAHGLKHIGHWTWGGIDGADRHQDRNVVELGRSRIRFRLGLVCGNPLCVFSANYIPPPPPAAAASPASSIDDSD